MLYDTIYEHFIQFNRVYFMLIKITKPLLGCALLTHNAFAADISTNIKHIGTHEHVIHLTQANTQSSITLPEYELSEYAQHNIHQAIEQALKQPTTAAHTSFRTSLPKHMQLGMNNVPVLDQGRHGTCATFATTAAIDALINQGDYISQLCLLQLGNYLSEEGHGPSGWYGGSHRAILERISTYGIINVKNQKKYGCAGVKNYPYRTPSSTSMTIKDYAEHSEGAAGKLFT